MFFRDTTNTCPDGISVSVVALLKIIDRDGKVAATRQNFQLTDGLFRIGIVDFVLNRKPKSLPAEMVICDFANVFLCFCLCLPKSPENRQVIGQLHKAVPFYLTDPRIGEIFWLL